MSYAKALSKAQCESVETTIRKTASLLREGSTAAEHERLTRRVMLGTMAGGKNPGPGRPEKNWAQCLVDDLRVFRATEGSTENLPLFGVEIVLWPTAAKKGGKWCRGVIKRRTVSWPGGTGTRQRVDGYATKQRTPRVMTNKGGGGKRGAAV